LETASREKILGKYRLIAELGRGGMGVVYLAVTYGPGGFSKLLVVKELRPELGSEPSFLQMFLDEARLAARLSHPNVVQTYEVGEDQGRYFMAMEYLEGQTLHRTISALRRRARAMTRPLHLRAISEVLLGLHYAHELCDFESVPLGVVHRDVSPHNVFLTYDGQVKLVDFGIAKALDARHETATGTLKGKVTYMAPEQVHNASAVDRRVDVFAAGAMLWEALVGRKLWEGVPVNEVLLRLTQGNLPPPPSALAPDVPPALDRICARAMAADREARYPTALAFREAIEQYAQESGEGATARDVGSFVAATFVDERGTNRSLIELELSRLRSGQVAEGVSLRVDSTPAPPLNMTGATGATGTTGATGASAPGPSTQNAPLAFAAQPNALRSLSELPPSPPRRLFWTATAVVVVSAALTTGAVLASRGVLGRGRVAVAAPPSTVEAVAAGAAKTAEPVLALNIRVSPASARVFLDDEEVPPAARASVRPRDGRPHQLRAEAEGYLPRTEIVLFDGANIAVNLQLDRRPADAGSPPAARGRSTPPPPVPRVPPTPARPAAPTSSGDSAINPQGGKAPKRAIDPWNPYSGG
jgi:eukaryotic-like serine/threonine-protein kinase